MSLVSEGIDPHRCKLAPGANSYSRLDDEESLLDIAEILRRWKADRETIASSIDPTIIRKVFPRDGFCLSDAGNGKRLFSSKQTCLGCVILSNLSPNSKVRPGESLTYLLRDRSSQTISIRSLFGDPSDYRSSPGSQQACLSLLKRVSQVKMCDPGVVERLAQANFLSTTSAISQYIYVSCQMERILTQEGLPCRPTFKWAYSCSGNTRFVEQPVSSTLEICSREKALGILIQLTDALRALGSRDFIHGEASVKALGFLDQEVTLRAGSSSSFRSPVTLTLSPSVRSSIRTPAGDRVHYSSGVKSFPEVFPVEAIDLWMGKLPVGSSCRATTIPQIATPCLAELSSSMVVGYRIGKYRDDFSVLTGEMGVSLFPGSFDFCLFLLGLMSIQVFADTVFADSRLYELWVSLWRPSELEKIRVLIQSSRLSTFDQLLEATCGLTLRCDALEFFSDGLEACI